MATTATGQPTESTGDAARPEFACKFCKRRKVKCDRLLPRCSICVKTKQGCEYPVEAAKPGPKLGTTRRKRRRSQSWERQQTNSHSGLEGATAVDRDLSADRATNADAPVGLTSASSTGGPAPHFSDVAPDNYPLTPESASLDVHTLAYIMHPSHDTASVPPTEESPLPDLDQPGKSDDGAERLNRITQACAVLGIPLQSLQG
ncbi:hypothetical protein A1O3_06704 [Capronia epimyces CBS 606.96]|uniref:Zn(2)-C6 fungal-type domain-containing protein n=1 Tax=Capronia epimyces CBS 606.96 TaxID=1182542 RepID=W9XRR5_9EURO|nr:uncharacterized protein A1O3_06704 [Capronia epimyces CBS 606.96]EXJ82888.1 hypothetical protein A1O3_06704 [Capronia epimyces CBS 606.96]